jgi:hypothetical protein
METAAPWPCSKLHEVDYPAGKQWVEKHIAIRREMTNKLKEAMATQQTYADKRMQPKMYAISNSIWLLAKNLRTRGSSKKLDLKHYGLLPIMGISPS